MKKIFYLMILFSAALFTKAMAQDSSIFPKGEIGKNTNDYTGTIWLSELNQPDSNFNFSIAQATYAPGSKLGRLLCLSTDCSNSYLIFLKQSKTSFLSRLDK